MRFLTFALVSLLAVIASAKPKHHHHAPTSIPSYTSLAPTATTPTWEFSPEQYYYNAKIYYERAQSIYDNFPHSGPAFYNAQLDEETGKFFQAQGKAEMAAINKTHGLRNLRGSIQNDST